jgi:hypothetical protein
VFSHRSPSFAGYPAALWLALYVALQVGVRFVRLPRSSPPWLVLTLIALSAAVFIFLALGICTSLASTARRPVVAIVMLLIGAAGWMLALWLLPKNPPSTTMARFGLLVLLNVEEVCRILAAAGVGVLLASVIHERNILLPAAVFAAFADYAVVHLPFGTVNRALQTETGRHFVHSMSAKMPTIQGLPMLTIGMADFLFLTFFIACILRFDLYLKGTLIAWFFLLTLSLLLALAVPVPALAPMALGFVAVNFRRFKLSPSEMQAMVAAAIIVLVLALGLFYYARGQKSTTGTGAQRSSLPAAACLNT